MAYVCLKYECRAPSETTAESLAHIYDTALAQIAWVDSLGFPVTVNFCEHHGSEDSYVPSPMLLAAAAARVTRNLRLQVNALVPFLDPLRLAEDLAVLDQLSHGRAEVLLLGGYLQSEFTMFGADPAERGRLMDECVSTLKQAWTGETFSFRGRAARVRPVPLQQPHPTLVMGGSSPAAARRAARVGDAFVGGVPSLNPIYAEECRRLGRDPHYQAEMAHGFLFVSGEPAADWSRIAPYCLYETNCYARWHQSASVDAIFSTALDADTLRAQGTYRVMRPEEVIAAAPALAPNDAYILHPLVGGMDTDTSWRLLRNFFEQVAPHVPLNPL